MALSEWVPISIVIPVYGKIVVLSRWVQELILGSIVEMVVKWVRIIEWVILGLGVHCSSVEVVLRSLMLNVIGILVYLKGKHRGLRLGRGKRVGL